MWTALPAMLLWLAGITGAAAQEAAAGTLAIDIMDARTEVTRPIDERLLLRLSAQGDHDWEVQVVERPAKPFPENLLYHSAQWHGPYPTQVFAWHLAAHTFGDERWVCVRGHPYEVAIRLKDMASAGTGPDARFVHGTLEVQWFHRECKRGFGY